MTRKKYFIGHAGEFPKVAATEDRFEFVSAGAGGGDMVGANNLSDVDDPDAARDNLNAQQKDTDLTAIAALDSATAGVIANEGAGWLQKTYAQLKTLLVLVKGDVGLGNVDNTSDVNKPVSTAQQTAIDDAEAAANSYTDGEITAIKDGVAAPGDTLQKLYNLIVASLQEVSVADIAARDAYNVPSLPFHIFVTNDGDGNWALYKATATGVGATFVKISDPDLLNAVMSNAAVKTAYESNADTNAFTNALLAKLNGIAAGATANSTDAALRARASHTGTQEAATISDFAAAALLAAPAETASTIGALLNGSSAATPNDTDIVATAETSVLKKITWTNVKAFLKTYFDTLYQEILVSGTNIKTINGSSILGSGDLTVTGSDLSSVISAPDTISTNKTRTIGGRYILDDRLILDGRLTLI